MKVGDDVYEVMSRFRMEFLNTVRRCTIKRDIGVITAGGESYGPFQTGHQVELPNWLVDILLQRDVIELAPEDAYDSVLRIQNLYNTERNYPRELHNSIPSKYLYVALAQKIRRLRRDMTSLDPKTFDEIERIEKLAEFLRDVRLTKILRVAHAGITQEKMRRMTVEEKWLCEELNALLSEWRTASLNAT
ncbi:MAG: hypothetical protein ACTSPE_01450 [Candidatus Thorarchaeota archaeon]|nr:MAG: hypothetical protein DRO73_11615 [Candidatus Thorarchaeota archaeon]